MSRAVKIGSAIGAVVLIVVLAVALAVASIGGEDDASSSNSGSQSEQGFPGGGPPGVEPPSGADRADLQAFQGCLEEQGVELPDPSDRGGGPPPGFDPNDSELQEAMSACQDELPEGFGAP
jgi:hypothetical protein